MKKIAYTLLLLSALSCSSSSNQLARSQKTMFWMDQHFQRYENAQVLSFLLNITKRLELAAHSESIEIKQALLKTTWKIHIFESSTPNAFSAGAGNLIITKSLIRACQSEAELAAILAHEMSHYYLSHSEQDEAYLIDREIEADTLALSLMEFSGYQLDASISALNILYRQGVENVSEKGQKNFNLRNENMTKLLYRKRIWGINQTREFNRIKNSLK